MSWEIRQGDALERLREMPDGGVHLVVCSPPYWGLRDYGTATWSGGDPDCEHQQEPPGFNGPKQTAAQVSGHASKGEAHRRQQCHKCGARRVDRQLGLEPAPDCLAWARRESPCGECYVCRLRAVFSEVFRVLRDDGTLWLNLAPSYAANRTHQVNGTKQTGGSQPAHGSRVPAGFKPKDLILIPHLVALALQADGWFLRSEITWGKLAPMPESVQDRPTKATESIFLFAKQERYYYDALAVAEPVSRGAAGSRFNTGKTAEYQSGRSSVAKREESGLRNLRNFWLLGPEPSKENHYACFPSEIPRRAILAGTSEKGCCPMCGAPWERVVEKGGGEGSHNDLTGHYDNSEYNGKNKTTAPQAPGRRLLLNVAAQRANGGDHDNPFPAKITTGWQPTCTCNAGEPVSAVILDPFLGSGTSLLTALKLGRSGIGIELSSEYCAIAERRLRQLDAWQPALL